MEKFLDFSTSVMWRSLKLLHMWRNFRFLHTCHAYKFEISPHDNFFLHGYIRGIRDKYQVCMLHTSYLSHISHIRYVEINLSCGEISDLYAREMWRNLKFLHMWSNFKFLHMTDVEKFEVSPQLACV